MADKYDCMELWENVLDRRAIRGEINAGIVASCDRVTAAVLIVFFAERSGCLTRTFSYP